MIAVLSFELVQLPGNHANNGSSRIQRSACYNTHQPNAATAIYEADVAPRQHFSYMLGKLCIYRVGAGARSAIDAYRFLMCHACYRCRFAIQGTLAGET